MAKLKQTGFDGVEVPLFEGDANHYKTIRKELDNHGLGCTTVTVVKPRRQPDQPRRHGPPGGRRAAQVGHRDDGDPRRRHPARAVPLAAGRLLRHGPTADEKKRGADVLRKVAEIAQQNKVMLAIEYLNRFECYFLTTAADAKALVQAVNHPNFRTMYDTFHANIEEKNAAPGHQGAAPATSSTSTSARTTAARPAPAWSTGTRRSRRCARSTTTAGWSSSRSAGRCPTSPRPRKVWRDLFPSAEEVYTQGLRFMKEKWAAAAPGH